MQYITLVAVRGELILYQTHVWNSKNNRLLKGREWCKSDRWRQI